MTKAYSEAAVEVLDILNHTSLEKVNLIPKKFINFLIENASKDYIAKLDYSVPINKMNIKLETKGIIGIICKNWWWSEEEKQEYVKLVNEKERKYQEEARELYNPDDLFKNRNNKTIQEINKQEKTQSLVEQKESLVTKLTNFVKRIYRSITNKN